jgi:hypothetical protein
MSLWLQRQGSQRGRGAASAPPPSVCRYRFGVVSSPPRFFCRSLLHLQGDLSHQGSSIHAEWLQHTANLPALATATTADHVQLTMGELLPQAAKPSTTSSAANDIGRGKGKDKAAAPVPAGSDVQQERECCRGTLAPGDSYWRLVSCCWPHQAASMLPLLEQVERRLPGGMAGSCGA